MYCVKTGRIYSSIFLIVHVIIFGARIYTALVFVCWHVVMVLLLTIVNMFCVIERSAFEMSKSVYEMRE